MSEDRPPPEEQDRTPERSPGEDSSISTAPVPTDSTEMRAGRPVPLGRLILGLVLVGIGLVWLLEALDVVSFSFLAVLPAALIIVGGVLLAAARTGRHGGLILLGIVLTVILTIASSFDIRLQGGVGERTERPTTLADVQREYHLSVGQLTLDFTGVDFSRGPTKVKASVGLGQLTVRIPHGSEDFVVVAEGHVGAGEVMMFGRQNSGLDVDLSGRRPGLEQFILVGGTNMLTLDLSVGVGQIEVTG